MTTDALAKRVLVLERSVAGLKTRMVDPDCIMTEEDYAALLRYREEKRAGTLVTHDALLQELG